ncbi:MAG TPA: type I secretion system permease/ATPase, partial [Rhizobiales bacterium]|nr:type I secretion system permease/ATPase [Hyphomicrobiales bacterium]
MSKTPEAFEKAKSEIKPILVFVALFSFCINLLMLVGPIYMLQIYDRVLSSGSIPTLVFLTVAALGLTLTGAFLEAVRSRVLVRIGGRFDELLSEGLFRRMHEASLAGSTTRAQPIRDLETVRSFVTGAGLFFFFDVPWTPLFLVFIYILHPLLFMVAAFGAILLFTIAIVSELATRNPLNESSGLNVGATTFAESTLQNAEAVEAMGMLPGLCKRWLAQHRRGLSRQAKASDLAGFLNATTKFIRPSLQTAILGTGAYLVLSQAVTPGVMVAASIVMGRALAPVEGAIGNWRSFVLARSAFKRVKTLLTVPGRTASSLPFPRPRGNILVEKLVAPAPGHNVPIIKGISFRLEAGEALGIIGPSASGKSSLAKLLVGAWLPSSGHARLDGMDVSRWKLAQDKQYVGYLPQETSLFEGTIAENIARFSDETTEDIIAAAQRAGAHDLIVRLPDAYDTRVGAVNTPLSGGQRQRIALARAVFNNPSFVVLDEPNSNLDSEGEEALRAALATLKEMGTTVVIIAHRPSMLRDVDKILMLRDGMIEKFGARDDILSTVTPIDQQQGLPKEFKRLRQAHAE